MSRRRTIRLPLLVLAIVILAGAVLRMAGAGWGFPLLLHTDEQSVVEPAIHMLDEGTLDPDFFKRPNHLSIYLSASVYAAARPILGDEPIRESYQLHTTTYVLLSRLVAGVLGTLTILAAYFVGKKFGRGTGLAAAALFAFFPSYVLHAHYATPDVPLTLLSLCVVLSAMRYLQRPRWAPLLLGAAFSALAVIEKYPGLLASTPLVLALILAHRRDPRVLVRRLGAFLVLLPMLLFAFSPYLFLRSAEVWADLEREARTIHLGQDGLGWAGNLRFYAGSYFELTGVLLLAFLLLGGAALARRKDLLAVPLLASSVSYWLVLSRLSLHWERWALPMYAGFLILAAHGLAVAIGWGLRQSRPSRRVALHGAKSLLAQRAAGWARAAVLATAAVALGSLAFAGVGRTLLLTLPDTRTEASAYFEEQGLTKGNSLYDGYTPFLPNSSASLVDQRGKLQDENVRYLVASSSIYLRYLEHRDRHPREAAFYREALALPLLEEFRPAQLPTAVGIDLDGTRKLGSLPLIEYETVRDTLSLVADWNREPPLMVGPVIGVYQLTPETRPVLVLAGEG